MLLLSKFLEKDEKIVFVIRHHWFIFFRVIITYLFLGSIPGIGYFLINKFIPRLLDFVFQEVFSTILVLIFSIYYLLILAFFFHSWLDQYLDIWIITNRRVIDIEQKGFFARVIAKHKLSRIQDVSSEVKGFFPTIFSYGNLRLQTAAAEQLFIFEKIPHPHEIAKKILHLTENAVQEEKKQEKI